MPSLIVPNYGLFIKIFNKRDFTANDLSYVDIHSVATLMQAALWSTPDRIISKKAWRKINYESNYNHLLRLIRLIYQYFPLKKYSLYIIQSIFYYP